MMIDSNSKRSNFDRPDIFEAQVAPKDPLKNLEFQVTVRRGDWLQTTENLLRRSGMKGGFSESAEDILQNAWIKISKWIQNHPEEPLLNVETFLYIALKHAAMDEKRGDKSIFAIPSGAADFASEDYDEFDGALTVETTMTPEEKIDADRLYDFVLHNGVMGGKTLQESVGASKLERTAIAVRMRLEGSSSEEIARFLVEQDPEFAQRYNVESPDGKLKAIQVIDRSISRMMHYVNDALGIENPPLPLARKQEESD